MARRPSALSPQQSTFVDGVLAGKSRNESALAAGYPNSSAPDKSELVRIEIANAREKLTDITQIKRVDVIDGLMDGIACARMTGDAGNMIKGWTEVAKILGHYAPEVKNININMNQQRMRSKFEAMSDEELIALQMAPSQPVTDVDVKTLN